MSEQKERYSVSASEGFSCKLTQDTIFNDKDNILREIKAGEMCRREVSIHLNYFMDPEKYSNKVELQIEKIVRSLIADGVSYGDDLYKMFVRNNGKIVQDRLQQEVDESLQIALIEVVSKYEKRMPEILSTGEDSKKRDKMYTSPLVFFNNRPDTEKENIANDRYLREMYIAQQKFFEENKKQKDFKHYDKNETQPGEE